MRRRGVLAWTVVLSGLWVGAAAAGEGVGTAPAAPAEGQTVAGEPAQGEVAEGQVPPAQVDLFLKREEARQRRDELLKVREATSQGDP